MNATQKGCGCVGLCLLAGLSSGLLVMLVLGLIVLGAPSPVNHTAGLGNHHVDLLTPTDVRGEAATYLAVKNFSWERGGFGTVGIIRVTIKNVSTRGAISNIHYKTTYYAESGVQHSSMGGQGVIEKVLQPGQTRTFEVNDGFISIHADKMSLQITQADWN